MHYHTTFELAEHHRNEMLKHAADARLARTARKGNGVFQSLIARFAKTETQPVAVAQVDTLPVPADRSAAA